MLFVDKVPRHKGTFLPADVIVGETVGHKVPGEMGPGRWDFYIGEVPMDVIPPSCGAEDGVGASVYGGEVGDIAGGVVEGGCDVENKFLW